MSVKVKPIRTFADCVRTGKNEIIDIFQNGITTSNGFVSGEEALVRVNGFGDLHDLCDANTLAYICDENCDFRTAQGVLIQRDSDSAEANEAWMAFGNEVQDALHEWIVKFKADHFTTVITDLLKVADFLSDDEAREQEEQSLREAVRLVRTHALDSSHPLFTD